MSRSLHAVGITLVEMLIAMAITIVMMGAVVTLFANVSNSIRNRRATIEMSGQLRHVRNMLQQDLAGATCPGLTWQRPESNHGYIEIIEGQYREGNASRLIDANPSDNTTWPPTVLNPEIDHTTSILPSSNLPYTSDPAKAGWATDGGGLGDYDDILMLTIRNEHEPFVGRMPSGCRPDDTNAYGFDRWNFQTIESPLAEVVWFAVENPGFTDNSYTDSTNGFFGEPGMRTIYRRTLLIAPWVNPYRHVANDGTITDTFTFDGASFKAEPGLVRILPASVGSANVDRALAALIAFQDRYDLSVRLEWDANIQRWKIMANTLGELTKRENRFGHFGLHVSGNNPSRIFPYAAVSWGEQYAGDTVSLVVDPEAGSSSTTADVSANVNTNGTVVSYTVVNPGDGYTTRPLAYVDEDSGVSATANAMLNDEGHVVRVVHGPVPLWGTRRGEDVMLTDALAFDLRLYDPGAPLYGIPDDPSNVNSQLSVILEPSDPGWRAAFAADVPSVSDVIDGTQNFRFVGQGAYVDPGYGYNSVRPDNFFLPGTPGTIPWFFVPRALSDVFDYELAPGYPGHAVYDTWSFHYENNGVNEDNDEVENGVWQFNNGNAVGIPSIDEGTNGLDDYGHYSDGASIRLGVDDVGERETVPPYDKPLRGMQVLLRVYERDSRQIRQVRVNQHFMPE
ncbi:MAG: type II secretion system GspH family protein [Planctomycetes bacterium]|nr:type II secretion system GspH family protein [Planctomycetota bacterium]